MASLTVSGYSLASFPFWFSNQGEIRVFFFSFHLQLCAKWEHKISVIVLHYFEKNALSLTGLNCRLLWAMKLWLLMSGSSNPVIPVHVASLNKYSEHCSWWQYVNVHCGLSGCQRVKERCPRSRWFRFRQRPTRWSAWMQGHATGSHLVFHQTRPDCSSGDRRAHYFTACVILIFLNPVIWLK